MRVPRDSAQGESTTIIVHHLVEEDDASVDGLGLQARSVEVLLHLPYDHPFHGRVFRQQPLQQVDYLGVKCRGGTVERGSQPVSW